MPLTPTFTVVIPVKPGGEVTAVDRLRAIDYPAECYEVLVAEGRRPSCQRNRAAAQARGEYLYFLDDDSLVPPEFLQLAARHFENPSVAAVGGPSLTPSSDTTMQRAFGAAFASLLGGGGVRNRYRQAGMVRETDDAELILCNLGFRRDTFLAAGGLDERLYPNEENELMARLRRQGMRLVHDPALAVFRSQRPHLRAFVRQLFTYGRGRAEQIHLGGGCGVSNLVPALFLLYLCVLPFLGSGPGAIPLGGYLLATLLSSFIEGGRSGDGRVSAVLLLVYPALHLSYGAGLIWGLLFPRFKGKRGGDGVVTVRMIKSLEAEW
ncbi:glycosyl transferase family 2 [Geobacter pickeringii]|uniref:Glycosyl transferase family 2 n=2 Tax=Geobacter pickeringii TaxID=345632 RepID=A0A0B5BCG6_9BACT|nr:glycosyltransferase [Geobacter pickeringii]AJE04202.1 glycosyl transferase family 2 [Geobacter pickeringii]